MEANFFHFWFQEIHQWLVGRRVDKVYAPLSGAWTIRLGSNLHLVCVSSGKQQALFTSAEKPTNPKTPPAAVGWWRKRIQGLRILECWTHWPVRQMACRLSAEKESWLILDLRSGLSLVETLPSDFAHPVAWPSFEQIMQAQDIFRHYPQISPPLRHTLAALDEESARELLSHLQASIAPDGFFWAGGAATKGQDWLVPWPIPDSLQSRFAWIRHYPSASEAAEAFGWDVIQKRQAIQSEQDAGHGRARKRLRKRLARVDEDARRLQTMADMQTDAELLKANLYRLHPESKVHTLEVETAQGERRTLHLDPQLSVRENMEGWFHKARKGRRGLEHVAPRRRELVQELWSLQEDPGPEQLESETGPAIHQPGSPAILPGGKTPHGLALHVYTSSDGLTILRGKNSKANHQLLTKVAQKHDLWFHAANGPGAHVILQCPGPMSTVPEQSLQQAAGLAALASYYSSSDKAEVICARAKHVHPIKGGKPGQVKIAKQLQTLAVPVDPDLETRLRREK